MNETVSVDEAISKGYRMVYFPIIIILVLTCICFSFDIQENITQWIIPAGFAITCLYWNLIITKWRFWAFDNVRNVHELKERAVIAKFIWPDGSIFLLPFLKKSKQEKWNSILDKFKQEDIFTDDYTIPDETIIYYSKIKLFFKIAFNLAFIGIAAWLFNSLKGNLEGAYLYEAVIVLLFGYFVCVTFIKVINTKPQIIINEKGIQTISTAFVKWIDIDTPEVIKVSGNWRDISSYYYLKYYHPNGLVKLLINDYNTNRKDLENLLRIYRGRSLEKSTLENILNERISEDFHLSSETKKRYYIIIICLILTTITILFFLNPTKQKGIIVSSPKITEPIIPKDTLSLNKDNKYHIDVKLSIPGGDSTGALINITKDGVAYQTINSEGIKYPVALDFNSNYLFECSKNNYNTKIVYFDTHIPNGREKEEFAKFFVEVELHKKKIGEIVNSAKPVGGVKYNPDSLDFEAVKK